MRGRKKKKGAYTKTFSIKITVEQYKMLQMNEKCFIIIKKKKYNDINMI